jgi:FkbM family methyltransferase
MNQVNKQLLNTDGELSLEEQLKGLLNEELSSIIEREKSAFDRLAAPLENFLVLYGAGGLGRNTLAKLRNLGIEPLAFVDNNPRLWHQQVDELEVLSPEEAAQKFGDKAVFIVTIWGAGSSHRFTHTEQHLLNLNCEKVVSFAFLFWKFSDTFLPYYSLDLPHKIYPHADKIKKAFSLWADETSRREYVAQLRWRMLLDFDNLPCAVSQEIYFPEDIFTVSSEEVFVDCGAYDGDTLKIFWQHQSSFSGKVIALEPDPNNFEKLKQYVYSLPDEIQEKVTLLPFAAGKQREQVRFTATGTVSSAVTEKGELEIDCVPLDELIDKYQPTLIKMDIEGGELDALVGAKKIIQKYSPILAICVYHCQDHLWEIPLLIKGFSEDYSFFLREHSEECWDLVFYAVPANRLNNININ